jgi:hypothetical protein
MDFIERFFGLSPDNGDGSTELLWCVAIAAVLVAAFCGRCSGSGTRTAAGRSSGPSWDRCWD